MDAISRQTWADIPRKIQMAAVGGMEATDFGLRNRVLDARQGARGAK